jgi:hypothetical protein
MKESEYLALRWKLLEYKLFYYYPEKVHESRHADCIITDPEYDILERQMNAYPEANPDEWYVGFPDDKDCGKLVMAKMITPKGTPFEQSEVAKLLARITIKKKRKRKP